MGCARARHNCRTDPAELLRDLDNIWGQASPAVMLDQVKLAAESSETLIRQQATEALGRMAAAAMRRLLRGSGRPQQAGAAHGGVGVRADVQPACGDRRRTR